MGASWWGPCYSQIPIVDGLEEQFSEFGVKFVMSLADPGQPYSCEEWQAVSSADSPLIIDPNQAGNFNSTPYYN